MTPTDKSAFVEAIARLAVAVREQEPDVIQLRVYFDALSDLEIEFVVAAAERLMRSAAFFPKVAEWRRMARQIERERQELQRAMLRKRPEPLCAVCGDSQLRMVEGNRFARCPCAVQRRLEILGRVPWPVLAEASNPDDARE